MIVWMPDAIYIFELKKSGTAKRAVNQINDKGYVLPFETDKREVIKVGVRFDVKTLTIKDWQIE